MMLWAQHYEFNCGKCGGHYYVNAGDPNDYTGYTPDNVKCPWCGAVETLGDEDYSEPDEEDGERDECAEVGNKSLPEKPPQKVKK